MQTKMLYWVEADGMIVRAEGQISADAAATDAVFAHPFHNPDIVGRNLFTFIEGAEVRHVYAMLHERVLTRARQITFDYRCDSSEVRRDMRMSLAPERNLVRYESLVLKETVRELPIPDPSPAASEFIAVCSMCRRYRYPPDSTEWKEIESILLEPDLPERFNFTHSICGECYDRCMTEVGD